MKTLYILFMGLLVTGGVMAQGCLPEGITFSTQAQIDSFQINYSGCAEIEGNVTILGDSITNLNGLNTITRIMGDLYIGNGAIVTGNPLLKSLSGLDNLTSIGGDFWIHYNFELDSITELGNLNSLGGSLSIYKNSLDNLVGLEGLDSIGGGLMVAWEFNLNDLQGLESLISIGGELEINMNPSLTNLSGLVNIDAGSITDLNIYNNSSLSTCEVQSVCDYLANPNGGIYINNNATGCNSPEEVETACENASVDDLNQNNRLSIYPNPSSSQITIELPTTPQKNTSLTIYNLNGQQLITQPIKEPQTVVDISELPKGVYFVKVTDDEKVMMGKVIKQ